MWRVSKIILKVCIHPSGRHTLTESVDGGIGVDLLGPLSSNFDRAEFHRAKNELAIKLRGEGHDVDVIE